MKVIGKGWVGLASMACAGVVFAATASSSVNLNTPGAKLVTKVINGQGAIVDTFPAVGGLTGFVVESTQGAGHNSGILYADPKGRFLVAGSVISAQGQDMTQVYTNEYINSKIAGPAYAEALQLNTFTSGSNNAPHKAIVIFDPNCIYCHLLYKELEPMIAEGQVQIRWLPVAFRDPSSPGKAAAMLNAGSDADASKLLGENEATFNDQTETGALAPIQPDASNPAVTEAFSKVAQNTQFFSKYSFQGTPTVFYKQTDGKVVMVPGFVQGQAFQAMLANMGASF